ncbi:MULTISPECIES: Lrp/AsnC family transcriptional regulator [Vibrio]|uniref:DNA-binding transcriptional activator DecR n=1 Tax=Vibrio owensii CAIM 1854 = LMG 25443 TaxID=1229493 RepID=A0A0C1W3F3_9VIBR|nr:MULTISPECIES: Lrp/AsnC family transcriptional regulator [Vibrio]KIF50932.1 transcriptional regulator [Vibrio owensii CAIM 1854 = LMG 25443]MDK9782351.1 Lrp/AsnC family transcriptional regulator [Vibrio sp. B172a]NOI73296.1 Lrp/AsnC family transcriptional regulator [Vibrio owensii]CAD7812959.1 Transcriptional regulator AsnC family [Vibrio sp. B1ASS3]CAE6918729.1 Transcriptional regulator AsnC family [Vibrio sp. B1ASS3]
MSLDKIDRQLLSFLQNDGTLSLNDLAERVNLTTTPCWKRLKKLEDEGYIEKRVALLSAEKLDLSFIAFVQLKTSDHSEGWYHHFVTTVSDFPEVMEFYRMAGEYDYMMKVVVKDMKCFDEFYKRLVNSVRGLSNVTSTFAMEPIKYTTELPIYGA